MTRTEREKLWNNRVNWDTKTQQLYDETYDKVYRNEMNRFRNSDKPLPWFDAEALALATNMAEDAVDNYLKTITKRGI